MRKCALVVFALYLCHWLLSSTISHVYGGAAEDVLSKEYLINSEWGPDIGELGLTFKFAIDGTFKTDANFEGGAYYSGAYKIVDKKLTLKIIKAGEGRELIGKTLIYNLAYDNEAIYFTQYLALESGENYKDSDLKKLWNHSIVVKNGQRRIFQNIKVITINDLAAIKDSTSYHEFPRENSKRFMFSIFDDKHDRVSDWSYTVPAEILRQPYLDGRIRLILRTAEKDRKSRYWYCIDLPIGIGGYDRLKLEGSDKEWNKRSIGWIKETDIVKMRPRKYIIERVNSDVPVNLF